MEGVSTVTWKQQEFPLTKTRTSSHHHFEILGNWWSDWANSDISKEETALKLGTGPGHWERLYGKKSGVTVQFDGKISSSITLQSS